MYGPLTDKKQFETLDFTTEDVLKRKIEAFRMEAEKMDTRDALTPDVMAGLKAYIASQREPYTIPKATDDILRNWLTGHGFISPNKETENSN